MGFTQADIDGWDKHSCRLPGYVKYVRGTTFRYQAPNGAVIGESTFRRFYKDYKRSGVVPQPPAPSEDEDDGAFSLDASHTVSTPKTFPKKTTTPDPPVPDPDPVIELPEPKLTPGHRQSGKATAKELSTTFQALLLMLTSFLAILVALPEMTMTDTEVRGICIPLANIFERSKLNERYGKAIVGSNDYIMLGYALYSYTYRVNDALRAKKGQQPHAQSRPYTQPAPPTGGGSEYQNGYRPAAPLPYSPTGLRGFTSAG